jgi:hypothetical protein
MSDIYYRKEFLKKAIAEIENQKPFRNPIANRARIIQLAMIKARLDELENIFVHGNGYIATFLTEEIEPEQTAQ